MLTDPENTLAFHTSRVFSQHRDMSDVPCDQVAAAISAHKPPPEKPEREALWFYGMNHIVALISARRAPLEPLSPYELDIVKKYYAINSDKAVRAFNYLTLICTREARHSHSSHKDVPQLTELFGKEIAEFFAGGGGESDIHKRFLNHPPKASFGAYVEALRWQFYNSKWSPGYGGKAWGQVTDCLVRFVKGEYSAEMMMDTVWTLSHNNGPIFNKIAIGLYEMYTSSLVRILDVQRSGQIPQAILSDPTISGFAEPALVDLMTTGKEMFPEEIGGYVDWYVVEALGSVHHYPQDKSMQVKKHGQSPAAEKAAKEAEIKAKKAAEAAKVAAEKAAKRWFHIHSNFKIKKINRKPQAA